MSSTVECYDPTIDEWKFVASMNNQRDGACVVTEGRYIYVISGYDGHSYLSSVEMYDPSTDAWVLGGEVIYRSFLVSVVFLCMLSCLERIFLHLLLCNVSVVVFLP